MKEWADIFREFVEEWNSLSNVEKEQRLQRHNTETLDRLFSVQLSSLHWFARLIVTITIGFTLLRSLRLKIAIWRLRQSARSEMIAPRKAPGTRLMRIIQFLCYSKTIERIYEPLFADFLTEYFDALAAGNKWQARWIRVRFYGSLAKTIGLFSLVKLAKEAYEFWKVSS